MREKPRANVISPADHTGSMLLRCLVQSLAHALGDDGTNSGAEQCFYKALNANEKDDKHEDIVAAKSRNKALNVVRLIEAKAEGRHKEEGI